MKRFFLLHYGYQTPNAEIHAAWTEWFASLGDRLVEMGSPFGPGREITPAGSRELPLDMQAITGYTIIRAESMDEAERLASACPFISGIRVYEARTM